MFFSPPKKKLAFTNELSILGEKINQVYETKFLGVMLDSKLSWQAHIEYISKKISKGIGILCKARKYLTKSCLITLYYSFIYPYMNYCLEVWGKCIQTNFSKIFVLQKRAIRIINSSPWRASSQPIFDELKILPLNKIYIYKMGIMMYKFDKNLLPTIFNDIFNKNNQVHGHNTRQHFHVPPITNSNRQRTVRYQGPIIGNYIFRQLSLSEKSWALLTYKNYLRKYLRENQIDL